MSFLLFGTLNYYWYVSLAISSMSCHYMIMPFVTFYLVHCHWSPTQSGGGIVILRLKSMSFLLLGTLLVCFINNSISSMSCHYMIMPFITFSLVHCLWSPTQSGRGLVISFPVH